MKILNYLLLTIFTIFTGFLLWFNFYSTYFVKYRYEATEGTIFSSKITELRQERDNGSEHPEFETAYRPEFVYEYKIGQIKYYGTRYRPFQRGESKEWAEEIVKQNSAGKTVTVFYNPDNPERSALSRETTKEFDEKFFGLVFLMLILGYGFHHEFNKEDKKKPDSVDGFTRLVPNAD